MIGKNIYFAVPGTTLICQGKILKILEEGNRKVYFVNNLEQLGNILLQEEEVFKDKGEAQEYAKNQLKKQYLNIVKSWTAKELLEYLLSLQPLRNEIDEEVKEEIKKSIGNYFDIFID
ncbi:hypothetical protein [Bacillus cereus]|uniref:hypothetical protein n=1 Tax=Bacillus cereus TaxID=1396 RepID=UPI0024073F4A|nr:hypothetical protein [Bacillus cereus]WIV93521.1 hypothetical protein QNH49_02990 [Bacillus bombysepticus]MDF9485086.1 hypothetical protein [Bacillus cereus]MDF9655040.1 hypothetical protein [Bacillus cereus]MDZ4481539.1 hypothetical protein [Bacillus cereus]MDZ4497363.1 hypothetical protein [Bacillus cereus]